MATVTLTQPQAIATPYFWSFTTLTDRSSAVVVARRQRGKFHEFQAPNAAAALAKINAYETYLSNAGVAVTQF